MQIWFFSKALCFGQRFSLSKIYQLFRRITTEIFRGICSLHTLVAGEGTGKMFCDT